MNKVLVMAVLMVWSFVSVAESTKPPQPLTTATLALRVLKHVSTNSHIRIIGACLWMSTDVLPKVFPAPAIEQYLPDLVVTVSNNPGENPWVEAGVTYENALVQKGYQAAFQSVMGLAFDYGADSGQSSGHGLHDERSRVVHVIGSPARLYRLPEVTHKPETRFGKPYYSSHADALIQRTETVELLYMGSHLDTLLSNNIGTNLHSWGPQLPRLMRVTQPSRFRASVVAAMHAADIVTNHGAHVKQGTTNRCGHNCVVSNVIYDPDEDKVIWQEVYPNNRHIKPGDANDFGVEDERKGHGNYVFVLWRKYRGCVQQKGHFVSGIPNVGEPEKR